VADRSALKRLGLGFAALTIAVVLTGAAVVKQRLDSQPPVALAGSPAVEVAATHERFVESYRGLEGFPLQAQLKLHPHLP